MKYDPILAADRAEETAAADALSAASTKDELVSVWWRDCEAFAGPARERLQAEYAKQVARFAPMGRAG